MAKKYNIQYCCEFAEQKNGMCLSNKYINTTTKMLWRCKSGHQWHAIFKNILKNYWCPVCAGNVRKTTNDIQNILKDIHKGYVVLDETTYKRNAR